MASFIDGKPFLVTERDLDRPWSGGKGRTKFRCYLCGYKFRLGDTARWQYTNDIPGAGGNPIVCQSCDGTKEEIVEKWKSLVEEFNSDRFWKLRDMHGCE